MERFQVGTYSNPDKITLATGFPMGLLEPIKVNRNWSRAAHNILRSGGPDHQSPYLVLRLLSYQSDDEQGRSWLGDCDFLVSELEPKGATKDLAPIWGKPYLSAEILAIRAFNAIKEGDLSLATELAHQLAQSSSEAGISPRNAFVWEMRARLLDRISGGTGHRFSSPFWGSMVELVSYDAGNAWALWVAHCRDLGLPVLPPELANDQGEAYLSRLGRGWFTPAELYGSGFGELAQSALGATLFQKQDLRSHMSRFPDPPPGFGRQGSWVKGARFAQRGQALAYEELARRSDLSPGWRMDLLRRASELHFLGKRDSAGLEDLQKALLIATQNGGTLSLRRRLRQWSEQAMVLSLARSDTLLARRIHAMAKDSFKDEEGAAYVSETEYWLPSLLAGVQEPGNEPTAGPMAMAKRATESGTAPILRSAGSAHRSDFLVAADRSLWESWIRWGQALAMVKGLSNDRQNAADKYLEILNSGVGDSSDGNEFPNLEAQALACVGLRLGDKSAGQQLLEMALEVDVAHATGWRSPLRPSPVPQLVTELRSSQLDLHALLGFCLAIGDMRGILAVAVALPGTGLTTEQKLHFLYPLPAPGPLRDSIAAQGVEPALVLAIARNESLFEPTVRSRAGALGFMQIMPFHYDSRGALPGPENWACPEISILKGAGILEENRRRYRGDPYLAVAAYNAGPGAASRWGKQLDGHPDRDIYLAWIGYPETRRYVEKVLIDREIYDWLINAGDPATD